MAYNDSGKLSPSQSYQLGNYTFELHSNYDGDEEVTGIVARMTYNGETKIGGIDIDGQVTVESWSVEANETEASVYVKVKTAPLDTGPVSVPFPFAGSSQHGNSSNTWTYTGGMETLAYASRRNIYHIFASETQGTAVLGSSTNREHNTPHCNTPFTHMGKTVYYTGFTGASWPSYVTFVEPDCGGGSVISLTQSQMAAIAWIMIYGETLEQSEDKIVARFAIETQQAVDPTQPEQWDEQPDTGDPQYRLDLTAGGALSGRHNDPLRDPSYSYVPADQDSVKGYGGGGDGGHGGGGGGGASTVIVYDFATDKAGSKEINAYARRHGYGSSGGRGGRGGDGCIIVYY